MHSRLGLLLTLSALALHCNTGGGGNEGGQAGASSGAGGAGHPPTGSAGAGQSSATAGRGGSTAAAGMGGSIARAASGASASGAGGTKASAGRGGSGAISGGGSAGVTAENGGAGTAGFPAENGGADTGTSGAAGAAGAGGSDDDGPKEVVNDDATPGHGACEGVTLGDVIDAIHQGWPNLASIIWFYDPTTSGEGDSIRAFRTDRGFELAFFHGSGDCPGGCINREYWYFETDGSCVPHLVGHYSKTFDDAHNCSRYDGEPLWEVPVGAQGGACP